MTALTSAPVAEILAGADTGAAPAGLLDEGAKREIRRAALTAVCVPGYQVPFGSREMPVARGWGSGGLQVTLGVIGEQDTVKVIDQGDDGGVNAVNLRRMIAATTGCASSTDTREATVIQTRHRIPEEPLGPEHVLVYQVPVPEPLRGVQKSVAECARMHAENDYSAMWVSLYEDVVRNGVITRSTGYPVLVGGRYVLATSPVPRWDVPKLHQCEHLNLYGAGREKRIYAIPPHTDVAPLTFDDIPFEIERVPGASCEYCGCDSSFLVEAGDSYVCSDSDWCTRFAAGDTTALPDPLSLLGEAGAASPSERPGTPRDPRYPILTVKGIGKVHGPGGATAVAGTGPEHGTAISPETGAVVAAWDVSFDVAPGEALGLIGESGSGKSTVLRCVIGDEAATSGHVEVAGQDVFGLDSKARRRLRADTMAVVYQDPAAGLDLRVTAGGNVAERLTAAGWRGYQRIRDRAAELLERVEVPLSRMDDPVGTFSGGMRQRVQIAKALATEPPVLLLDEPTTGLDASVAAGVLDLLRGLLSERDIAAVVVSHDFAVIEALTERSLVMQLGRVVERGLTDQLFQDPHHPYTQRLVAAARR
ncbi:alpha-D-ribose 1-methylphosphonate 5-phosphate C-P-lyase PhnJ [Saccharopolyspora taberi]|uniref:ABC transporter domain-containing protein n=1 Tax=Saccharopolyspora taberi TaxID=60895 RepID=A0ABN3V561_9PSEU